MKIKNYLIEQWNKREGEEQVIFIYDCYKLPKAPILFGFNSNCFGNIKTHNLYSLDYYTTNKKHFGCFSLNYTKKLLYEKQAPYSFYEEHKEKGNLDIFSKWEDKFAVFDMYIDFNTDSIYIGKDEFDLFKLKNKKILDKLPDYILDTIQQIKNEF